MAVKTLEFDTLFSCFLLSMNSFGNYKRYFALCTYLSKD